MYISALGPGSDNVFAIQFKGRFMEFRNYSLSVFDWKSSFSSTDSAGLETFLREKCESGPKVNNNKNVDACSEFRSIV